MYTSAISIVSCLESPNRAWRWHPRRRRSRTRRSVTLHGWLPCWRRNAVRHGRRALRRPHARRSARRSPELLRRRPKLRRPAERPLHWLRRVAGLGRVARLHGSRSGTRSSMQTPSSDAPDLYAASGVSTVTVAFRERHENFVFARHRRDSLPPGHAPLQQDKRTRNARA